METKILRPGDITLTLEPTKEEKSEAEARLKDPRGDEGIPHATVLSSSGRYLVVDRHADALYAVERGLPVVTRVIRNQSDLDTYLQDKHLKFGKLEFRDLLDLASYSARWYGES